MRPTMFASRDISRIYFSSIVSSPSLNTTGFRLSSCLEVEGSVKAGASIYARSVTIRLAPVVSFSGQSVIVPRNSTMPRTQGG